jgi:hypothetical protein
MKAILFFIFSHMASSPTIPCCIGSTIIWPRQLLKTRLEWLIVTFKQMQHPPPSENLLKTS